MKKMWLGQKSRRLIHFLKAMKPLNATLILALATVIVIFGTYGIWQLRQFISPESRRLEVGQTVAQLRSSDNDVYFNGLDNNLDDITEPEYISYDTTFAGVAPVGGQAPLTRLQGEVLYYDE